MLMKTLLLVLFGMLALPAWARLGETKEQLETRYGKGEPVKPEEVGGLRDVLRFQKGDFGVFCGLFENRCDVIMISKGQAPEGQGAFSEAEIATLLEANASGKAWKETTKGTGRYGRDWQTIDGTLNAHLNDQHRSLFISTTTGSERRSREGNERDKAKLKGF